jgi:hypothetical protein
MFFEAASAFTASRPEERSDLADRVLLQGRRQRDDGMAGGVPDLERVAGNRPLHRHAEHGLGHDVEGLPVSDVTRVAGQVVDVVVQLGKRRDRDHLLFIPTHKGSPRAAPILRHQGSEHHQRALPIDCSW